MKKIALLLGVLCVAGATAQQTVRMEYDTDPLHIFTLENGFTIFVKEDDSAALVHTEFASRAGYSAQTAANAGFFPLYERLFTSTTLTREGSLFREIPVTASCNADSATFTADVPRESLPAFLAELAECARKPAFSDERVKAEFALMKQEVTAYEKTTSSMINGAIDSRIFADAPWKQESGIYPELFSKHNAAEVRTWLSDIGRRYYTPDNCAIFLTGAITVPQAYALCVQAFSDWEADGAAGRRGDRATIPAPEQPHRFVLTDASFSADMTQVIMQYTGLTMSQADILSAAYNGLDSPYKALELADPVVAIRSKDYLAAASVQRGNSSRLILQALLEAPYSFSGIAPAEGETLPSPAEQAVRFAELAGQAAELSRTQFVSAQTDIEAKYRAQAGNAIQSMELLADFWAMDAVTSGSAGAEGSFYDRFLNLAHDARTQRQADVLSAVRADEPFIFVLVKDSVYESCRPQFDEAGFAHVTRGNASWYHDQLARARALEQDAAPLAQKDGGLLAGIPPAAYSSADFFYSKNMPLIESGTLQNGIPVTVKQNAHSQSVVISVRISGGECASPEGQRLLRTVLVNAYARNVQDMLSEMKRTLTVTGQCDVQSWTDQTASYVTVECLAPDAETALLALFNALVYGDVSPITADRLVREQKGQWASNVLLLDTQLEYNAFKYLYRGTAFAGYYDQEADVLAGINLHDMQLAYSQLLDAALYTFVIAGDITTGAALDAAERTFGLLHVLTERTQAEIPQPQFQNKTRRVQLRHLYQTNKTPEMAPDGVPILIPTENFSDPAHYYFAAPQSARERALYNALLYELAARIQPQLPTDSTCTVRTATTTVPIGALRVDAIQRLNAFATAYRKARQTLLSDLQDENPALLRRLKNTWIQRTLLRTQTNGGTAALLQEGIREQNPYQYLETYIALENSVQEEFLAVLESYLPATPTFRVTSVDSKD